MLVDHVFPNLEEKDIERIGGVNKTLHEYTKDPAVWHDLYYRTFGMQPNPFTEYKWPEMYRWRKTASLYTWGSRALGRLGYGYDEIEPLYRATGREFGVCLPKKVHQLGSIVISDVVAGGYSFTILTGEGKLIGIGDLESRSPHRARKRVPQTVDSSAPEGALAVPLQRNMPATHPFRVGGVRNGQGRWVGVPRLGPGPVIHNNNSNSQGEGGDDPASRLVTNPPAEHTTTQRSATGSNGEEETLIPPLTHSERAKAKELKTYKHTDVEFMSVSSGRQHVLALDYDNNVWLWDWSFAIPGVKLGFPADDKQPKILNAVAGWGYSAVVVDQEGIIIWNSVEEKQEALESDTLVLDEADITRLPGTNEHKIIDVVAGEHMLIYLSDKGDIYYINTASNDALGHRPVLLEGFKSQLDEGAKFVKLSGSFVKFAAFTDNDKVFMGHRNELQENPATAEPRIVPELQNVGCISVAVGDHHNLALLRGGKLLTWGRESKGCGAFGLGKMENVTQKYGISPDGGGLDLESPTPVEVKGRVLAIAAAGWQSAAVITQD